MYYTDAATGDTLFSFNALNGVHEVVLEGFDGHRQMRIPMQRRAGRWTARLALSAGLFFYHFQVDGKTRRDRDAGKCKTADGRPYSLALINGTAKKAGHLCLGFR